jgi:hypothetical protein
MASRHFRAHQRFLVKLPVTVESVHRRVVSKGSTVDLGIGGSACELDTPLRLGEDVTFRLDDQAGLLLRGEVAWVGWAEASAVRLGLRFHDQAADDLAELLLALGVTAEVGT